MKILALWVGEDYIDITPARSDINGFNVRIHNGVHFTLDQRHKSPRRQLARKVCSYINRVSNNTCYYLIHHVMEPTYLYRKIVELIDTRTLGEFYALEAQDPHQLIHRFAKKLIHNSLY